MPSQLLKGAHALSLGGYGLELALVDLGTAFWLVVYVLALVHGLRNQTYAVPLVAIAANFSWELIAAVYRVAPVPLWHYGDVLWLSLDAGIVWTLVRYGREQQQIPELRRAFFAVVGVTFVFAAVAQLALEEALSDEWGFLDAYMISVMMSVLFFFLYFARRSADGASYGIAWGKLFGNGLTSAGFVFLYPALHGQRTSTSLLYVLCVANVALDAGYVALLARARRTGSGSPGVLDSAPSASTT
jgi:hypothetical protein